MIDPDWEPALEVPNSKVVNYLLNIDHPKGGPKARFFLTFGFDPAQPAVMAEALIAHAAEMRGTVRVTDTDGRRRMILEDPMRTPDMREPKVRTVWQLHEGVAWRLITAVPLT